METIFFNPLQSENELSKSLIGLGFKMNNTKKYHPWNFSIEDNTVLYIPTIFNSLNSSNYDGVQIALHWYFELIRKQHSFAIILLGTESKLSFFEHCKYSVIVKCPNVYYFKFSLDEINKSRSLIKLQKVDIDEAINNLKYLYIKSPSAYKSHHSIANEWALKRYFNLVKEDFDDSNYNQLKLKIHSIDYFKSLHFRYEEVKLTRQKIKKKDKIVPSISENLEKQTVAIIDDEATKGWRHLFEYILGKFGHKVILFNFHRDETKKDLIERLEAWIEKITTGENPVDVFVVDLRLHIDDFGVSKSKDLTGINVIEKIKKQNNGAQVIVSTASNKVWRYKKLIGKMDYFLIKESPETADNKVESKNSFHNIEKALEGALENSYLAQICRRIKKLKEKNYLLKDRKEFDDFISEVFDKGGKLDQLVDLLTIDHKNDSLLNQCLLICYQIIENYCSLTEIGSFGYSNDNNSGIVWLKNGSQKTIFRKIGNDYQSIFKLQKGRFVFQRPDSRETIIKIEEFDNLKTEINKPVGIDSTSLVQMISVFKYRHNIDNYTINKLMELRYYRSNVAAHLTGNVDLEKKKITAKEDIDFIISVFEKVFIDN